MEPDRDPRSILAAGLAELGLASKAPIERLAAFAELLETWAARLNLTAHRDAASIARRLILDAIALANELPGGPTGSIADLGSGAGFPGLPIAAVWPEASVTMVEARERRHHFQRTAIRTLAISNARPVHGRAEELAATPHRIVIAQAMAPPRDALAWMARWAAPDGWLLLPLSADQSEVDPPPGVRFHGERSYTVPLGGASRRVWIGLSSRK